MTIIIWKWWLVMKLDVVVALGGFHKKNGRLVTCSA